jgi:hypothetical protein
MSDTHSAGYLLVLGSVGAYWLVGAAIAVTQRAPRWVGWVWLAPLGALAVQAVTGVALAAHARGPSEGVHWVYGVVSILALLAGNGFSIGKPARLCGTAMVLTASLILLLSWRLASTG